jgi:transcriptional regulator with XRE-family HTH domain
MSKLGERIRELLKKNNLSQTELTSKIKVSKAQMNRYINHGVNPPSDVLKKMSDVLGTTVDYLVSGATDEKAKASLKNAKVLEQYRELETLPESEKNTILKVVNALIRDFKSRQTYLIV